VGHKTYKKLNQSYAAGVRICPHMRDYSGLVTTATRTAPLQLESSFSFR